MTTKTAQKPVQAGVKSKETTTASEIVSGVKTLEQVVAAESLNMKMGQAIADHRLAYARLQAVTDKIELHGLTAELRAENNLAEAEELRTAAEFLAVMSEAPYESDAGDIGRQYLSEQKKANLTIDQTWEMPKEWRFVLRSYYRGEFQPAGTNSDSSEDRSDFDEIRSRAMPASKQTLTALIEKFRAAEAVFDRSQEAYVQFDALHIKNDIVEEALNKNVDGAWDVASSALSPLLDWQCRSEEEGAQIVECMIDSKIFQSVVGGSEGGALEFARSIQWTR